MNVIRVLVNLIQLSNDGYAERYLSIDMSYKFKRMLSNFRCSGYPLMVELGRHQHIDREYRYGLICIKNDINVLEDEMHLFVHCMIPLE